MESKNNQPKEQFTLELDKPVTRFKPRRKKPEVSKSGSTWKHIGIAGQMGFDVAVPMVLGLIIGARLDAAWGTGQKATLIAFGLGVLLSAVSLVRTVRDMIRNG